LSRASMMMRQYARQPTRACRLQTSRPRLN